AVLPQHERRAVLHVQPHARVAAAQAGGGVEVDRALAQVENIVLLPVAAEDLERAGAGLGEVTAVGAAAVSAHRRATAGRADGERHTRIDVESRGAGAGRAG